MICFINAKQSINTIIGNEKRFMAHEIIKRLETNRELALLQNMSNDVEVSRKNNNKLHEVWELSFDWKDCRSNKFIYQKLDYMHNNPCAGKWSLCANSLEYLHNSAPSSVGWEIWKGTVNAPPVPGLRGWHSVSSYMHTWLASTSNTIRPAAGLETHP